jgi:hypothetical protein
VPPNDPTLAALSPAEFEAEVNAVLLPEFARDIVDIQVRRRARRRDGNGRLREFDLWYQFRVGPIVQHIAIEVRRRSRPVSIDQIEAFFAKISEMSERPHPLMVSLAGFQEGAKTFAVRKGIGLYVLDKDLKGRTILLENPATRWRGRMTSVRLAKTLAHVLADAISELHQAGDSDGRPWSSPATTVRFPVVNVEFIDGRMVMRPTDKVWIPPSRRGGRGRVEPA